MKKNLHLFFILSSLNGFTQTYYDVKFVARDTSQSLISIVPYWNKNEYHRLRLTNKELNFKEDTVSSEKTVSDCEMGFKVLDSTEKSYRIEWRYLKNLKQAEDTLFKNGEFDEFYSKYQELKIIYTTNELGTFNQFENLDEIDSMMGDIIDIVKKKHLDPIKGDAKQKKRLEEYYETILNKNALVQRLFTGPISQFHNMLGFQCYLDDTLSFKIDIPNPVNGEKIAQEGYLYISSIDTTTNEVEFVQELYPDSEKLNKFTFDVIKKAAGKNNKEVSELEKTSIFEVSLYNQYFINLDTSTPTYVKISKDTFTTDKKTKKSTLQRRELTIVELLE
jgi:hypothetical protein